MYPKLLINENAIRSNVRKLWKMCRDIDVEPMAVVKVFAGDARVLDILLDEGVKDIGDSRIRNLKIYKDYPFKKWLVRSPMISQAEDVILYSDVSFNSEFKVIEELNKFGEKHGKLHEVMLMIEMGDLREGIYSNERLYTMCQEIKKLNNIKLLGVGANYNCLNGITSSIDKLQELVDIKDDLEEKLGFRNLIVSGGSSASFKHIINGVLPEGINQIRTGIGWILGVMDNASPKMDFIIGDGVTVEAEIIELSIKPSLPWGETTANVMGEVPVVEDRGMRKRAICALGRQDIELAHLFPKVHGIEIIGASSDHLTLDVHDCPADLKVGSILELEAGYLTILRMCTSNQVEVDFV